MRASLALVLLLCGSARAMAPERRAELLAQIPNWQQERDRASRMTDAFLAAVARDPGLDAPSFRRVMDDAWKLLEQAESRSRGQLSRVVGKIDAELAARRISGDERNRRVAAAEAEFQTRMLWIYGNLLPRIVDEAVVRDGRNAGRSYAGSGWRMVITSDEGRELTAGFDAQIGLPPESGNP